MAQETTTLATCWKITRRDAAVYTFTSHDLNLVVGGLTYLAASGFTPSAIASSSDFSVGNLDVAGALSSASMTDADLVAGLWDFAAVIIFEVNWSDLSQGVRNLRSGTLGNVKSGRLTYQAELRDMMQPLSQMIGRRVQPACDADLGAARCGVNLAPVTTAAVVFAATNLYTFVSLGLVGFGANYFVGGKVTWTSGANNGQAREIKAYDTVTGEVQVFEQLPYTISSGNLISIYPGCDKSAATCRTKFSNIVNFQGFPFLPGRDALAKGPP